MHRSVRTAIGSFCACLAAGALFASITSKVEDPVAMKKIIEASVVSGANANSAKIFMEAESFRCSFRTDAAFKKHMHYLYCRRKDEPPRLALWEVAFETMKNGSLTGDVVVIKTHLVGRGRK
jgi:hypothetical protein